MAAIVESGGGGKGKKRKKASLPHVDMTPMVDLGFLLLTFFVMTSTFSKSKVMEFNYPGKPKDKTDQQQMEINNGITFIVSQDKIYYYEGGFIAEGNADGKAPTQLVETNFSADGVRKVLTDKNRFLLGQKENLDKQLNAGQIADTTHRNMLNEVAKNREALKVVVKTDEFATSGNFINLIDELKITSVATFGTSDMTAEESALLSKTLK